ncbi:MAG: hypothetical protein AAFV29_21870, partial [Myxococcota bacterium]
MTTSPEVQFEGDNCSVEGHATEVRPAEDHNEEERMARATPPPRWMTALDRLASREAPTEDRVGAALAGEQTAIAAPVWYLINERESRLRDELVVDFFRLQPKSSRPDPKGEGASSTEGSQFTLRPFEVDQRRLSEQTSSEDAAILAFLLGSSAEDPSKMQLEVAPRYGRASVRSGLYDLVLPRMAASGRLGLLDGLAQANASRGLTLDDSEPYRFGLVVKRVADQGWKLWGRLWRGEEEIEEVDLAAPRLALSGGLLVFEDRLAYIDAAEHFDWLYRLRRQGPIVVPEEAQDAFFVHLATMPNLPDVELPAALHWSQVRAEPTPRIGFMAEGGETMRRVLYGRVSFMYG